MGNEDVEICKSTRLPTRPSTCLSLEVQSQEMSSSEEVDDREMLQKETLRCPGPIWDVPIFGFPGQF